MNTQWQPIDTVPELIKEDGNYILLAVEHPLYGTLYSVGYWAHDFNHKGYWKSYLISSPTHWMTLIPLIKD